MRYRAGVTPRELWSPPADARQTTRMGRYLTWLQAGRGLTFDDYAAAWQWSVDEPGAFWSSIWEFLPTMSRVSNFGWLALRLHQT